MTVDAATRALPRTDPVRRRGGPVLGGFAVLVLTWILVIPPFGGSDEFDHAYRAAAAARGQWFVTPTDATRGTGAWLEVPDDIVDAARPECQARIYTTSADCIGTARGDTVRIASGAGRYHPLFYAVVGTVARPFQGTAALYVMRLATASLCLGLLALALVALRTWVTSRVGLLAPVLACTPVVVYSCSIVAPNGLEIVAALTFWISTVGLLVADLAFVRKLVVVAAVSGVVLCTLRPLGPLWCLLAASVVLAAVRGAPGRWRTLLARRDVLVAAAVVAVAAVQSVAWTMSMGALKVGEVASEHTSLVHRLVVVAEFPPLWVLQSIAAFPLRNNATSPAVYVCYLVLFSVVLVMAYRHADRRVRIGLAGLALGSLVFAYATTVSSYDAFGAAWQGRYGLPLTMGLAVLSAFACDRSGYGLHGAWPVVAGLLYVAAQSVSVAVTLRHEVHHSPLAESSAWLQPALWLVVPLAAAGAVLLWWGGGQGSVDRRETPHA